MIQRLQYASAWTELARDDRMVFVSGPRQVGKTTFANAIAGDFANRVYCNWDVVTDRQRLIQDPYYFENVTRVDDSPPIVVFDEIHKHADWKNYLKGVYDAYHDQFTILVTGSGRLDLYQRGGDSLAGRYRQLRLWPLSLAELHWTERTWEQFLADPLAVDPEGADAAQSTWARLREFSGFPEPYVRAGANAYRRWSNAYHRQLIREDIRDMTEIRRIDEIELLFSLLPDRVGAPLSIPSLSRDLKVAYNTVRTWLSAFERFYLVFTITPWAHQISRAVHKERKTYLFDYPRIGEAGARFENMVAVELHRSATRWTDLGYGDFSLHYIRTKDNREVDFLLANENKPCLLVEAKMGSTEPSANLIRFQKALNVPAVQLLAEGDGFIRTGGGSILVAPAAYWLPTLP